jgi:glycosyltransferase involved in cell wall biosynthesis
MAEDKTSRRHCMVVYAPYPYGETRVQRQAEALIRRGFEVDVICPQTPQDRPVEVYRGVTIHRVNKTYARSSGLARKLLDYIQFFIQAASKLIKLHRARRYDVVQAHNVPDFLVFVALIPKLTGAGVLLDLHDLMPEFYEGRFGQESHKAFLRLIRLQEKLSCRFADHVITVSEHWRQALIKRGVPPAKCSVVMNLADADIFRPLNSIPGNNGRHPAGKGAAPNGNHRFRLFYHGYMPERYGLDLVLRAMDRVREQIPGIHLTLVGGGEHVPALKQLAQDLGLKDRHVEFTGLLPAEQLPPLIAEADVGVVPYRQDIFTDSLLPTKLMEYALMGLPCIVARTSAISSYFDDTMVEFFAPGDVDELAHRILALYSDPERLARRAEDIKRFNERYNWAKTSAEYAALVERLGSKRRRGALGKRLSGVSRRSG